MNALLSAKQAARQLGISPSLVRRYCRQNRIGNKISGAWVITQEELDKFKRSPRKRGRPTKGEQ